MTTTECHEFLRIIGLHYPGRFVLSEPTRRLWESDLHPYSPALALQCLQEWVRWHGDYPPQLGEIVARCRQEQARQTRLHTPVLPHVPAVLSADQATFAQLQLWLLERSVWPWTDEQNVIQSRLTPEACAAQCAQWAGANTHRPGLAADLRAAAARYQQLAGGGAGLNS